MGVRPQFGIPGPPQVTAGGAPERAGGSGQRVLLALLPCRANRSISSGQLIGELPGDRPDGSAEPMLRVQISGLRKTLADRHGQPRLARVGRTLAARIRMIPVPRIVRPRLAGTCLGCCA